MKTILAFTILLITLLSCNNNEKLTIRIQHTDSVDFETSEYFNLTCYSNPIVNSKHSIAIENTKSRTIRIYNDSGRLYKNVDYGRIGGISEGKLVAFDINNMDSIFLLFHQQIAMIDQYGRLKYSININELENDDSTFIGNYGSVGKILWHNKTNRLFVGRYSLTCAPTEPCFYNIPQLVALNMQTNKFEDLPVYYPETFKQNYYGDAIYCFNERADDNIITCFSGSKDIKIYNAATNETINKEHSKSTYEHKAIQPLDKSFAHMMNKKFEHLTVSPMYMNLIYDPYNEVYYRLFKTGLNLRNEDSSYNNFSDKEHILMVLDKDFKLIDEINLGKKYLSYYSFITEKGLYVLRNNLKKSKNENRTVLTFDVFSLKPKQL